MAEAERGANQSVHCLSNLSTLSRAAAIPQVELYAGRVGLIANTLSDRLLSRADVVVSVGYVSGWWGAVPALVVSWCAVAMDRLGDVWSTGGFQS